MSIRTEHHHPVDRLYQTLDTGGADTAVSVIVKVRGEDCDVDCLYCYEKRKEAPGGARVSPDQIGQLARTFRGRPLAVELHGGEPLTAGQDHIAKILRELATLPQVVRVSMQTNGVRLDDEWLDLFDELCPGLQIGISLDGDARGNAWRIGYDGKPVYPKVAAALALLARRGRTVGVIAAVTPAVLGRAAAVLDHLAGFPAVNAVSFVPCFDAAVLRPTTVLGRRIPPSRLLQQAAVTGESGPAWAIHPTEYAQFVLAATARWITAGHFSRIKLDPAVSTIRRLHGLDTGFCHFSNLKCHHVFTLYPDGRLGSCDELPWPQAHLLQLTPATRQEDVTDAQHRSELLHQSRGLMAKCTTCDYQATCGGGCTATRGRMNTAGGDDAYCDYRMRMIDGIAALLAQPDHPEGAWCRTLRWHPRTPNSMADVERFLARWDDSEAVRGQVRLHTSEHGNINTVGLAGVHEADDLDPAHPRWREAIEPGAWPLVDTLTSRWHLVTYDSCQGHPYTGLDLEPAVRTVGILPRNRDEYARAAAAVCRAVTAASDRMPAAVTVRAARSNLTCEHTKDTTPVLDISLHPAPGHDWATYFAHLDQATAVLTDALNGEHPDTTTCPCPAPQEDRP